MKNDTQNYRSVHKGSTVLPSPLEPSKLPGWASTLHNWKYSGAYEGAAGRDAGAGGSPRRDCMSSRQQ